jgi:carboxypeptidase Taq
LQLLRTGVHAKGRYYTSEDLCRQITGEPLNAKHFLLYAGAKYGAIYAV